MKHLRKSILTLLALTLFGGMGAWAQGPTNVTRITTDLLPASWENNYDDGITLEELQAWGFVAVDASVAQAWTGAPTSGEAYLFYAFDNGEIRYVRYENGNPVEADAFYSSKGDFYLNVTEYQYPYFYTSAAQEIELTKSGANQWSLGQTPDYDLELQVEYYEAHALKNIPAGWTVLVNGFDKTAAIDGDSLMITETDSVTLVPTDPRRVKSVTLADEGPEAVLVNIDGITLDITGCTTWAQIIARNPGVIWDEDGWIGSNSGILEFGSPLYTSDPYDPAQQSNYRWQSI